MLSEAFNAFVLSFQLQVCCFEVAERVRTATLLYAKLIVNPVQASIETRRDMVPSTNDAPDALEKQGNHSKFNTSILTPLDVLMSSILFLNHHGRSAKMLG